MTARRRAVFALLPAALFCGPVLAGAALADPEFDPKPSLPLSHDVLQLPPDSFKLPPRPRKPDDVQPGPSSDDDVRPGSSGGDPGRPAEPTSHPNPNQPDGSSSDPGPGPNPDPSGGGFVPQGAGVDPRPGVSPPGLTPTAVPPPPAALPAAASDPDTIVAGEILVISNSVAEATALAQTLAPRGLTILRRQNLGFLGGVMLSAFRIPDGRSVADVLQELRQDLPQVFAGPNILFEPSGSGPRRYAREMIGWPSGKLDCGQGLALGVIDTGLDGEHPAFAGGQVSSRSFLPAGVQPASADHGTAVAALLVGRAEAQGFGGLLPAARLTLAAIFHEGRKGRVFATTERVVLALDWLGGQGLRLINLSLSGPEDQLMGLAMSRAAAKGLVLVAAAGNGGSDAPPAFPAAHPDVIAVTAVDAASEPFERANRGDYIDFAAPGVDVWSARSDGRGSYHSGTSFAVPFVLAALAVRQAAQAAPDARVLASDLRNSVQDLGAQGRDPVFGWGLIQQPSCGEALTATK